MNTQPNREEALFNAALLIPPAGRAAYLAKECAGDVAFCQRIKELLRAHEQASHFLEQPPTQIADAAKPRPASSGPIHLGAGGTKKVTTTTEKPGDKISHYKLLQTLGEGGCGTVYMAEQSEPVRRKVALKVIKLGMDTKEVIARFEAERQALAMMDHPNIAKVLDAGATNAGRPYFVMELVRGIPITTYCNENSLSTPQRLDLFTKVCHAIQHAHQKGIIHRDIKPSNILVTLHDGVPVPKVIDFGIAKATDQSLTDKTLFTELHAFMGTPAYTSPEQAEMSGLDIDTRADIYSLGVLLYELLTGHLPFDPEKLYKAGLDEMRRTIREVEPPRPSTRVSTLTSADLSTVAKQRGIEAAKLSTLIRGDLDWIVMKALEKDRTRRYESASSFAQDINRYLGNEAILARPPSTAYVFSKLVRRHKVAFAAGSAVAASLVIGLGASTWLFFKEKTAHIRAVAAEQEQIRLRTQADTARANEQKLRVQAEADEMNAKTAAVKSEQVASFMKDMLGGVGPSVALGRDTTMLREILDKTAERLGKDLQGQPEVEAELRTTLGKVYLELGDFRKSEPLLREALELRRKLPAAPPRSVAESLMRVAAALLMQGKFPEAETLSRESLMICRTLVGTNGVATADALHILGMVLTRQVKLTEAEPLHREALALFRKFHGMEHLEVAGALAELAFNQHMEGKLAESEALYREGLVMQRKLLGDENPQITILLVSLGAVLEQQHKIVEAEALYRECLAMQKKFLGNEHPNLAATLSLLSRLLGKQGKTGEAKAMQDQLVAIRNKYFGNEAEVNAYQQYEKGVELLQRGMGTEAEAPLREALTAFRRILAPDNQATVSALGSLGLALGQQKRWVEAEALLREALVLWKKLGGDEQASGAQARFNLGWSLQQQGKLAEAESLLREVATIYKKLMGAENPVVANTLNLLVKLLDQQGKAGESEPVLRDILAVQERSQPGDWQTFDTRSRLGGNLLSQKKYAEAEPFLLAGYDGLKQRAVKLAAHDKFHLRKALERLVQLYEATAQPTKAVEWKAKLKEFEDAETAPIRANIEKAKKEFGAESWEVSSALLELVKFYQRDDRTELAEPVAREILRIREKARPDNVATWKARSELGEVLTKRGFFAEAEPLVLSGYEGIMKRKDRIKPGDTAYIAPSMKRIVAFYEAIKQSEKVAEWKQKLAEFEKVEAEKKSAAKP